MECNGVAISHPRDEIAKNPLPTDFVRGPRTSISFFPVLRQQARIAAPNGSEDFSNDIFASMLYHRQTWRADDQQVTQVLQYFDLNERGACQAYRRKGRMCLVRREFDTLNQATDTLRREFRP